MSLQNVRKRHLCGRCSFVKGIQSERVKQRVAATDHIVRLNQPRAHSILAERRKIGIKHNSTSFLVCFIIHRSLRESNVFAKIQVHRRILL